MLLLGETVGYDENRIIEVNIDGTKTFGNNNGYGYRMWSNLIVQTRMPSGFVSGEQKMIMQNGLAATDSSI